MKSIMTLLIAPHPVPTRIKDCRDESTIPHCLNGKSAHLYNMLHQLQKR